MELILRLPCSHSDLQCLHRDIISIKLHIAWILFYEGIKLWKNTYLNIRRMGYIKNKTKNICIFQMHVNSALAPIQIPPGT